MAYFILLTVDMAFPSLRILSSISTSNACFLDVTSIIFSCLSFLRTVKVKKYYYILLTDKFLHTLVYEKYLTRNLETTLHVASENLKILLCFL